MQRLLYLKMIYIIIGIVVVIFLYIVGIYNGLIRARNRMREAWSDIEVQLKRRYNLIPNLVQTVKGYASHEKGLLENVTAARTRAMEAKSIEDHGRAENMLSSTLKTLFAVSENYPDLKANANFLELQRELSDTENKIQASRRFYNTNVMALNTAIESFPKNIIAGMFKFNKADFFAAEEAEKDVPKVEF
jgi:LemA protein